MISKRGHNGRQSANRNVQRSAGTDSSSVEVYNVDADADVQELADFATMPVVGRGCSDGHNYQPDLTETDFEAETCTRCHMGRLIRPIVK